MVDAATYVRACEWVFTVGATLGCAIGIFHVVDGLLNLRAVRDDGSRVRATAWLWIAMGAVGLISQGKLSAIGALSLLARSTRPPSDFAVKLVTIYALASLVVLAIQLAIFLVRRALRGRWRRDE